MNESINTWLQFQLSWGGVDNFLMSGECIPFDYTWPGIERIVDVLRNDPDTQITSGSKGDALDTTNIAESFKKLSVTDALRSRFSMVHYKLQNFYDSGQLLDGFEKRVMEPWTCALRVAGFTWTRCYPILFISGPQCATNYHMDFSHVLAWQIHGTKMFSSLRDPERWAPLEMRIHSNGVKKPREIAADDVIAHKMTPGTVLWNAFLTPHWVEASDQVACSLNISHGGLRYQGKLCLHEEEIEQWQQDHPNEKKLLF